MRLHKIEFSLEMCFHKIIELEIQNEKIIIFLLSFFK